MILEEFFILFNLIFIILCLKLIGAGTNYSTYGTLEIVTDIEPTVLFYKSDNGEKHNLIEQIAVDKVKELIKTSDDNYIDVEIYSVTLL